MQQVIIGLDTTEMVSEMELIGQLESDFDMEEIDDEESGTDDDDEDDDDVDEDDDEDDDDESGDYENVTTLLLYLFFSLTRGFAIIFFIMPKCCRNGFH